MLFGWRFVCFSYFSILLAKLAPPEPSLLPAELRMPPPPNAAADAEPDQADADQHGEADVDHAHGVPATASSQVEQHQLRVSSVWSMICCTVGSPGSSAAGGAGSPAAPLSSPWPAALSRRALRRSSAAANRILAS